MRKNRRPGKPAAKPTPAVSEQPKRQALLQDAFREDLAYWVETDPAMAQRLLRLVEDTLRHPFTGLGKPESLKEAGGIWSRRLTDEHRIVYRVTNGVVDFLQARFHYSRR